MYKIIATIQDTGGFLVDIETVESPSIISGMGKLDSFIDEAIKQGKVVNLSISKQDK